MNQVTALNHYLTEVPQKTFFNLKCKALAFNVLEKISYVALFAIMATVFIVSYSTIALTGTASLVLGGLIIAAPLCGLGIGKFAVWKAHYAERAEIEGHVAVQLNTIAKWKSPQIEQFLREEGLDPARIPLDALRQINQNEPLCALLPLIARFKYLQEKAKSIEEISRASLHEQFNNITDVKERRAHQLFHRQFGWHDHEFRAIPEDLNAAVILQMIQQPTDQQLDIQQPTDRNHPRLPRIGECRAKEFDERMFDRDARFGPVNDDYVVFHPALRRPPLTLAEIEQNLEPRALRLKLFPTAIRA